MESIIVGVFIIGYLGIALEHNLKIDKLIPALVMMVISWTLISLNHLPLFEIVAGKGLKVIHESHGEPPIIQALLHHLGKTSEILFFLIGAMTIVEIIDFFNGFASLKTFIKTKNKVRLLWIICVLAFILSAIIDNLTATIVLITILRKLVSDKDLRMWYTGLIVITANAGGAWSPIGDVTTTMLWIAHKVEVPSLIKYLLLPSIFCLIIPTFIASKLKVFKGDIDDSKDIKEDINPLSFPMLCLGLLMIIFVPIFKTITHLPPYVGMMLSLAVVATVAELVTIKTIALTHVSGDEGKGPHSPLHHALAKIEFPSILFFLGILMAVAALESLGTLFNAANWVSQSLNSDLVVMILGVGSAVIDNVPLVAASIGMFNNTPDSPFWHFVAYAAGTGGSMLIIGSAAGVVAMGMEKISFFWYFKNIAWLALIGYAAGITVFLLLREFVYLAH
jgi:Na+/H+ antiporter NhaD/arsenite permease-like protein